MSALSDILKQAEQAGWQVSLTGKNHYRLAAPDGKGLVYAPNTPSDHRALANLRSELRRNGLDVSQSSGKKGKGKRQSIPAQEAAVPAPAPVPAPEVEPVGVGQVRHLPIEDQQQLLTQAAIAPTVPETVSSPNEGIQPMATKQVTPVPKAGTKAKAKSAEGNKIAELQAQLAAIQEALAAEEAKAQTAQERAQAVPAAEALLAWLKGDTQKAPSAETVALALAPLPDDSKPRGVAKAKASGGSGSRAPRLDWDATVVPAIASLSGEWKLSDLADKLKRDAATTRNYVNKATKEGLVEVVGDDPSHSGRGKAPKLYRSVS